MSTCTSTKIKADINDSNSQLYDINDINSLLYDINVINSQL